MDTLFVVLLVPVFVLGGWVWWWIGLLTYRGLSFLPAFKSQEDRAKRWISYLSNTRFNKAALTVFGIGMKLLIVPALFLGAIAAFRWIFTPQTTEERRARFRRDTVG